MFPKGRCSLCAAQWWTSTVFWTDNMKKNGDVNEVLIIDNDSAHTIDTTNLLLYLKIKFLSPNVTSKHQISVMGTIAALNIGYT